MPGLQFRDGMRYDRGGISIVGGNRNADLIFRIYVSAVHLVDRYAVPCISL
jgi:hypothetical protein